LVTLGIRTVLEWKQARDFQQAQQAVTTVHASDPASLGRQNPE